MRVCLKEPDVLEKFPLGKNDQNLLKNEVFRFFCRVVFRFGRHWYKIKVLMVL